MSAAEYRQTYDLRAGDGLASASYRERAREQTNRRIAAGLQSYEFLPRAVEAARHAGRRMSASARDHQRAVVSDVRPGDHSLLPPGSRRADGRDAAWARISQQRRRELYQAEQAANAEADLLAEIKRLSDGNAE